MRRVLKDGAGVPTGALLLLTGILVLLAGCGGHATRPDDLGAADAATATLGGYPFGASSHRINHVWMKANPRTSPVSYKGWGTEAGATLTISFAYGGLVKNVKTLRVILGAGTSRWLAMDTRGNVHLLKAQDPGSPAHLYGVARGDRAAFFLPRAGLLKQGYVWYNYYQGRKNAQHRIMSMNASSRGKSGLMWMREVDDSNHDGRFTATWAGPDHRQDVYAERGTFAYHIRVGQAGGYVRQ